MTWASVNLDFLIALPRRCGSLHFQTAYSEGELTEQSAPGRLPDDRKAILDHMHHLRSRQADAPPEKAPEIVTHSRENVDGVEIYRLQAAELNRAKSRQVPAGFITAFDRRTDVVVSTFFLLDKASPANAQQDYAQLLEGYVQHTAMCLDTMTDTRAGEAAHRN